MDKKEIILLLLKSNRSPLVGTTRLQKLLFLIEKEKNIIPEMGSFKFEAYKFGPASKELYDDIEFLLNIGFITKSNDKEKLTELKIDEIENYTADIFLSNQSSKKNSSSNDMTSENDSVVYRITNSGSQYLYQNDLVKSDENTKIGELTNKFNGYSLTSLLQYVYSKYPDFTEESEIKDDIL